MKSVRSAPLGKLTAIALAVLLLIARPPLSAQESRPAFSWDRRLSI